MIDWAGVPIAPSQLQAAVGDHPRLRAYGARPGRGLGKSFEHYLASELLPLQRWEQVRDVLLSCVYRRDEATQRRRDVWLHPEDFETSRSGDCEDHALWAWVQLVRLNWDVRFTVGLWRGGGHAWVTLYRPSGIFLLETTAKREDDLLLPSTPDDGYEPVWSVDGKLRFYVHAGGSLKKGQ